MPSGTVGTSSRSAATPVRDLARQFAEYFSGRRQDFDAELRVEGTEFQVDVWTAVAEIPYGEVRTYGEIADGVGRPHAYRAVGSASGRNAFQIVVPCHRVVASNGIGGYAGRLDVKRFLLSLEGVTDYSTR